MQRERYEEDENCSAFFFKNVRARGKKRVIQGLKKENGDSCEDREEIAEMTGLHCGKLFNAEDINIEKGDKFIRCLDKKIPLDIKQELDKDLKLEESYAALKTMKDNKVPGIDGLTKEFYISFWDLIGHHLLEIYNEMYACGKMNSSMREGIISLLYKKDDPTLLANYRPLTMLCVDYKILSKVLSKCPLSGSEERE